jgi:hypothetical protein
VILLPPTLDGRNQKLKSQGKVTPLSSLYDVKAYEESEEWNSRWAEVTRIQGIEFTFKKLMKPLPKPKFQLDVRMNGHYRRVLPA